MKNMFLMLLVSFGLVGCVGSSRPEDAVNGFFDALKSADMKKLADYVDADPDVFFGPFSANENELIQAFLSTMKIEVSKTKITGDKAKVSIKLRFVDAKATMKNSESQVKVTVTSWIQKINSGKFNAVDPEAQMQKEVLEILKGVLTASNAPLKTIESELDLVMVDSKWKLSLEKITNARLFEGIRDIIFFYAMLDLKR